MIYLIAILTLCSCFWYIHNTNLLIIISAITIIVCLGVLEMSLGRYIDLKFKKLVDYMEGHISVEEAIDEEIEDGEDIEKDGR